MLDDYFSSSEFLASVDAGMGGSFEASIPSYSHQGAGSVPSTPLNPYAPPVVPVSHQLGGSTSPFADSGIGLNLLAQSASGSPGNGLSIDAEDDVFTAEARKLPKNIYLTYSDNSTDLDNSKCVYGKRRSPAMQVYRVRIKEISYIKTGKNGKIHNINFIQSLRSIFKIFSVYNREYLNI